MRCSPLGLENDSLQNEADRAILTSLYPVQSQQQNYMLRNEFVLYPFDYRPRFHAICRALCTACMVSDYVHTLRYRVNTENGTF